MQPQKLVPVVLFAVTFAFVEAAVVVYLRQLLGANLNLPPIGKHQLLLTLPGMVFLNPQAALAMFKNIKLLHVEELREAATLLMLISVALAAGKTLRERLAYFILAFALWDIFYYVFLRLTIGWPQSLGDIDILFLLPAPWVAPVIVPVAISLVMTAVALVLLRM